MARLCKDHLITAVARLYNQGPPQGPPYNQGPPQGPQFEVV